MLWRWSGSTESNCWFSFASTFQLCLAVESSSLFHLCIRSICMPSEMLHWWVRNPSRGLKKCLVYTTAELKGEGCVKSIKALSHILWSFQGGVSAMVYADHSGAVVPVLVLLLWGDLLYVLPCVILLLCFSVLLALRLPRLGKKELILVLFVRLFDLFLFWFVGFLFLLVSEKGCGLWLWHSLDLSLTFCLLVLSLYVFVSMSWWIILIFGQPFGQF